VTMIVGLCRNSAFAVTMIGLCRNNAFAVTMIFGHCIICGIAAVRRHNHAIKGVGPTVMMAVVSGSPDEAFCMPSDHLLC
jgi:hypothetical protein